MISADEYRACVEKYSDMIMRIAINYCGRIQDAEDIVQEVFVKLLDSKAAFTDEEHRKYWFIRVTINQCKNLLRSAYHRRTVFAEEETLAEAKDAPAESIEDGELKETVFNAVMSLPESCRIIVYLYYYEGYSVKEISMLLHKSESSVLTGLHRSRKKMKEILKEAWCDE